MKDNPSTDEDTGAAFESDVDDIYGEEEEEEEEEEDNECSGSDS